MQIRLPVLPTDGKLNIPADQNFEVVTCIPVDVNGDRSTQYTVVNEASLPNLFQRTIYLKGRTASARIGTFLLDTVEGVYTLKVDDVLNRPAGLDLQLTLKLTTKEKP